MTVERKITMEELARPPVQALIADLIKAMIAGIEQRGINWAEAAFAAGVASKGIANMAHSLSDQKERPLEDFIEQGRHMVELGMRQQVVAMGAADHPELGPKEGENVTIRLVRAGQGKH